MREIQFRETSADTERIKDNTNGIKTGSSKNIDLLKSREDTAESSGATRFSNTSVDVSKSLLEMRKRKIIARKHEKQNQK